MGGAVIKEVKEVSAETGLREVGWGRRKTPSTNKQTRGTQGQLSGPSWSGVSKDTRGRDVLEKPGLSLQGELQQAHLSEEQDLSSDSTTRILAQNT